MYTVRIDGQDQQVGDLPTLAALVKSGRLSPDSPVFDQGNNQWKTAGAVTAAPAIQAQFIGKAVEAPAVPPTLGPADVSAPGGGVGTFLLIATLGVIAVAVLYLPELGSVTWVLVIASAIWVGLDAKKHQLRLLKHSTQSHLSGTDKSPPAAWVILTLLFWIIGFPVYLAKRKKLILAARVELQKAGRPA